MKNKLELSLSLTIDWLKFAENKNAMLIGANGAAIFGIVSLLNSGSATSSIYLIYIYEALLFLFVSAVFCLVSFIPQVDVPWLSSRQSQDKEGNLLAYADIAAYNSKRYLEALYKQDDIDLKEVGPFEEDMAELVVLYSRIALRKYSLFNFGVWCVLSAIVTPVVALAIYFVRRSYVRE